MATHHETELALANWRALPHHPVTRAAIIAGVSKNQIYILIRRGVLLARHLGARTMVDTASLARLVDEAPVRQCQPRGVYSDV